jgi:hypothetical protein
MADIRDQIEALLGRQETAIRQAVRRFLLTVRSPAAMEQILAELERGDTEAALRIVDSHINRMGDDIAQVLTNVGRDTMRELSGLLPEVALAISFDPTFPRAAELMRENRLRFIREFTAQQRDVTRTALARALDEGLGPQAMVRELRDTIGLTFAQDSWVRNYQSELMGRDSRALNRVLRDRRFDPTVERAIELDRPLTANQIDKMVERYRSRFRDMRVETIARTEAITATSLAREESVRQMMEQTGIEPGRVTRIWHAHRDSRTRDWHASMDRQERGLEEPFTDGLGNSLMYPGDRSAPPETVINCRCTLIMDIAPPA